MTDNKNKYLIIRTTFKTVCLIVTSFMVGYWVYKFCMNEDITVIEYKTLRNAENAVFPEFSICFDKPFLNQKLHLGVNQLNKENYIEYLKGAATNNETYMNIKYDEITFDLFDYLHGINVVSRAGRNFTEYGCRNRQNCHHLYLINSYNGFDITGSLFFKCFGVEINRSRIKDVFSLQMSFKKNLEIILAEVEGVYALFNHPGQLRLRTQAGKPIWTNSEDNKAFETFDIKSYELLKKRKKRTNPCYDGTISYDEMLLSQQIEIVGCRTPYQQIYENFPLCTTEMKNSVYRLSEEIDNVLEPCQEISQLSYDYINYGNLNNSWNDPTGYFPLNIMFPDRVKEIRNTAIMDIHALIGNIGGYVGLFLGKILLKLKSRKISLKLKLSN